MLAVQCGSDRPDESGSVILVPLVKESYQVKTTGAIFGHSAGMGSVGAEGVSGLLSG